MEGPGSVWQQAADCFEATMASVGDDRWETASGCGDWTVRELVDHVIFWQANLGQVVGAGTTADDGWDAIKSAVATKLADPSVLEGDIEGGPMNGMPKHMGMGLATADVLLHSWDLGQAIGVDVKLPAEAVAAVHMGVGQIPEEMLRMPQMFGPEIAVPDDASAQDKLLGFTGRQP
ncbi:MAG: TIGR03086 family metal-binding protein [Actinomycetota bacterium]